MDLRQLRYFLAIVDHGSVTRAAEALRVAQPALSLHLKRLEEDFGCQLLHRAARGVVPTESGRRLAQRAQTLLEDLNTLRDDVRGVEATPTGPVSVGIPTSLGTVLTVPLVTETRARFPGVRLRVVEALSGHMRDWVASGEVDMAVVFGATPPGGAHTEFLARETLSLVSPADTKATSDTVELVDALAQPLILPGRPHGVREEVERAAMTARVTLNVIAEVDALDQIKALVANGVGHTVLSHRYAQHGPPGGRPLIRPIVNPTIERTVSLAHTQDRPLSLAARAVMSLALELVTARARDGWWT